MKTLILLIPVLCLSYVLDEPEQLKTNHPLQSVAENKRLLSSMQSDIRRYFYETPLSSYAFFDKKSADLISPALITWAHGDIYLKSLAARDEPSIRPLFNNQKHLHLGDYRYDIFTLLSDLLLLMQEESDFSDSKERAILGNLIDAYFLRLDNENMHSPYIDDALSHIRQGDVLSRYTKLKNDKRILNTRIKGVSNPDERQKKAIKTEMNSYLSGYGLLPIKGIALDPYGDYLILCEGISERLHDDIIFTLSAYTLPVSYRVNEKMKKEYWNKSLFTQIGLISSSDQKSYAGTVTINQQKFFVDKLSPELRLKPRPDDPCTYKEYAKALGYTLAGFHSNSDVKTCQDFCQKAKKKVRQRLLKTELISMVYAYNEILEEEWQSFNSKRVSIPKQ